MALHQEDFVTLGSHLAARAAGIRPREGCTGWGVPRAFYARDVPGLEVRVTNLWTWVSLRFLYEHTGLFAR